MAVMSRAVVVFKKYPLIRGMLSYGAIWPISSLIQQTFEGRTIENYDWARCARFGLFASCYVAPTLYSWLTIANVIWPGTSLRIGLIKTAVETITYTPFAMCSFYFGMSLLEQKPLHEAIAEVKAKFWPTYKVGATVWPVVAMVNFCFIPPRNKVPFISMCSLFWSCFLAYMKHLDKEQVKEESELAVARNRFLNELSSASGNVRDDMDHYRQAALQAERLLEAREASHRQQIMRLEQQASQLRGQLAAEIRRRQAYVARSGRAARDVQRLRSALGDSLRTVSQDPALDSYTLEHEARKLDSTLAHSLPPLNDSYDSSK